MKSFVAIYVPVWEQHQNPVKLLLWEAYASQNIFNHRCGKSHSVQVSDKMESSSRLFVRNLPPSITPEDFRNHFSMGDFAVTDAKVIPQRRIGYLGYKSSEDATKAVRYFDKTFIRMSRIRVELARSVGEANTFFNSMEPSIVDPNTRKQIEEQGGLRPIRKRNRKTEAPNSDHETNNKISKRPRAEAEKSAEVETADRVENTENISKAVTEVKEQENIEDHAQTGYQEGLAVNDEDWLRSRTSRLLGLLDDNEGAIDGATELQVSSDFRVEKRRPPSPAHNDTSSQTDAEDTEAPEITEAIPPAQVEDMPRSSRLFVRNISYTATEEDLRAHFEAANKGVIDEVGYFDFLSWCGSLMNILIGTSDVNYDVIRNGTLVNAYISETYSSRYCCYS